MIYLCIVLFAVMAVAAVFVYMKIRHIQRELRRLQGQYAAIQEALDKVCGVAQDFYSKAQRRMDCLTTCIDDLKSGIVPDYERAKAAAKAVDDFNTGLAGIMGYDPMEAIKRDKRQRGEG